MTNYKRGDVILLPFPFTDLSINKKRPAVIVSTDDYNKRYVDVIVMPITGNLATCQPEDTKIEDWREAGLAKPSLVKPIIGTIEQTQIIHPLGIFSLRDLEKVEKMVLTILGF